MFSSVVYIIAMPMTNRDYERFGANTMALSGLSPCFINVVPLIFPRLFNESTLNNRYDGEDQIIVNSKPELKSIIAAFSSDIFVVSLLPYNLNTYWIYLEISKSNIHYAYFSAISTPRAHFKKTSNFNFFLKLRERNIYNGIINRVVSSKSMIWFGFNAPNVILLGGVFSQNNLPASLVGKNTKLLFLHTLDYDLFLQHSICKNIESSKAVFIDAPSPRFSKDALIPGISTPLTEKKYYPSLCRFFDLLEIKYNVTVEIAAHPGAPHESKNPEYFGGRNVIVDSTCEMISKAKVVINRDSTAVNFCVLYNKPVIFITSSEAKTDKNLSGKIVSMANSLGKKPINIDNLDIAWENELLIDEDKYANYINNYIKKAGTDSVCFWESVANYIKQL